MRALSDWIVNASDCLKATLSRLITSLTRIDCNSTSWNTGRWVTGTSGRVRPLTTSGGTMPEPSRARLNMTMPEVYSVETP